MAPHRPNTTLGTAASRSTTYASGRASALGAYWLMNNATPTATGTPMITATADASTVPKARAAMPNTAEPCGSHSNDVKKLPLSWETAGIAFRIRNAATAAISSRTRMPAVFALQRNAVSPPVRCRALWRDVCDGGGASLGASGSPVVVMSGSFTPLMRPSDGRHDRRTGHEPAARSAQGVDRVGDLGADVLRQRNVALAGDRVLAGGAGGVAEEALQRRQLGRVIAGRAHDLVGHQDIRVRVRVGVGVVELQRQVLAGAGDLRLADEVRRVLRGQLDELAGRVADRGVRNGLLGGEGQLEVTDAAGGLLDVLGDQRAALVTLAARSRPLLVRAVGPVRLGLVGQVVGEVEAGAGAVRPVERLDALAGQCDTGVVLGDGRVVPVGDLAGEDLGQCARRQVQVGHARQVVADRDRTGRHRQVDRRAALAARVRLGLVGGRQREVRTGPVDGAGLELGDTGAGTAEAVVDVDAGTGTRVGLDPLADRVGLRGGTGQGEVHRTGRALDGRRGCGAAATTDGRGRRVVVGATGRQQQGAGCGEAEHDSAVPFDLHLQILQPEAFSGARQNRASLRPVV